MLTNDYKTEDILYCKSELESQKKIVRNAFKVSIILGFICVFFVVLNLSILFTVAGGVAGTNRKVNELEQQIKILKETIIHKES
ncbi:hypothetical protein CQA66_06860 [Helicobacter aurati]|uniref:Uncharacterized protein n=1 Tax=Helicobacter aurati TaxID=137778 RepID=A0A3D8J224_9HELI|nr:hypothetical protein [Helicobacter aurati]RDU71256.1 hypothetical protein CQA66_06860 [Helicobacter aurati]